MRKPTLSLPLLSLLFLACGCRSATADPFDAPRKNAVLIIAQLQSGGKPVTETGSGFFLDSTHVATCFHVVFTAAPSAKPNSTDITPAKQALVVLSDGEVIRVDTVTAPTEADRAPLENDFAVLKLHTVPKMQVTGLPLSKDVTSLQIGAPVSFSGYPLVEQYPLFIANDPTSAFQHTFLGTISGYSHDLSLIGLEAPVNHGSSGSALINAQGEVIGIVTYEHSNFESAYKQAMNTPIEADKMTQPELKALLLSLNLVQKLGQSNSNGLGYARSINALNAFLQRHPETLKN